MLFGAASLDRQSLISNVIAPRAKASRVFDVPVVLSTVETKVSTVIFGPQLKAISPDQPFIERSSMKPWDDNDFVHAIETTGKKKIVLGGLWTETCLALATVQAIFDGYEVYVVEDCCGDLSQVVHGQTQ